MSADWRDLSRRAAFESHRLIGWIFWDPVGVSNYAALGVPDGVGYYVATRAAPLAAAGDAVVAAVFGSIHPGVIKYSLDLCRQHTTFVAAAAARDAAVVSGLRDYAPEIVDPLTELGPAVWDAVDALPVGGRSLFAAHRAWPRPDDPLLSAWLAVNCIREWRGDTHWAIQIADGLSPIASGILDGAWRSYDDDWLPRSRGADDSALRDAYDELDRRGFVTDGKVNRRGTEHRQLLEDRLDDLTVLPWQHLGEATTRRLIDCIAPVGERLLARIDATAGPKWMPAARTRA
ncbi:SCO6745 family protein [Mycobacterium decipiens]|uniref:SalK n=1 Tax=Mycobacterium decipiens TaxID=1430326 RepID=A0A1X2LQ45_9MYCO|nr:hypothetical protein [Mycobacterium decipiens]OSC38169.1 hypothetical protein B8W66_20765 [Mycobacterium decipiens]